MRRPVHVKCDVFVFPKVSLSFMAEGVQSGPQRSRARSLRRQRTLDGEDRSVTIPPGRKGSGGSDFWSFLCSCFAPKATLSPPFHPHSSVSDCFARCQLGVLVSAGAAIWLSTSVSILSMEAGPGEEHSPASRTSLSIGPRLPRLGCAIDRPTCAPLVFPPRSGSTQSRGEHRAAVRLPAAHYSHVRIQAKRTAPDSLSTKQAERTNLGVNRGVTTQTTTQNGMALKPSLRKSLKTW